MKNQIKISALLFNVFMALAIGVAAHAFTGISPLMTGGVVFTAGLGYNYLLLHYPQFRFQMPGTFFMAVQVEIWENTIKEQIFKDNQFLRRSIDVTGFILNSAVVHIPQAGAASNVVKNREILPAQVKKRTDTDITYVLDEYTTDPILIPNADTYELSYDKRASVTKQDAGNISELVADDTLIKWAPADNIVKTTGNNADAGDWVTGLTGNRKKLTAADVRGLSKKMNKQNIPSAGRCLLLDADMEEQLKADLDANQMAAYQQAYDVKSGVIGRLYGFDIYMRSDVLLYDANDVVKAFGSAVNTDDNPAALAWHESMVEFGATDPKMFQDQGNPQYYGDIYSFLIRAGGRINRADEKGVWAIIADA